MNQPTSPASQGSAGSATHPPAAGGSVLGRVTLRTRRRRLFAQPRLLPAIIFVAVLMIGIRIGDIWTAASDGAALVSVRAVQAQAPAEPTPLAVPLDETEAEPEGQTDSAADATDAQDTAAGDGGEMVAEVAQAGTAFDPATLSETELVMLQSLAERRSELEARERALDQREALITVAERRLDEKLEELRLLRGQIEEMLAIADEEDEEHILSLVRIYESMRPSDAAAIFDGLDLEVVLAVLQRMREQKSAPILASMNPERARVVTTELALRRQLPTLPNE